MEEGYIVFMHSEWVYDFMRWRWFRPSFARSASARKRKAGRWHRIAR